MLVHMYQQDGIEVLRKSGAWADLLASVEAVRRDQSGSRSAAEPQSLGLANFSPHPLCGAAAKPWRAGTTIASSVSIMLQARQEQVVPAESPEPIPPYARD